MSTNTPQAFSITIPSTVTAGTPVDCSASGHRNKTLYLPPGSGYVRLAVSGTQTGVYDPVMLVELGSVAQSLEIVDDQRKHRPDFAWARIDRVSGSGSLTAQIVGQPIPGGATGATGPEGPTGPAGPQGASASPGGPYLLPDPGDAYVLAVLDGAFEVGAGVFVAGEDGVAADGTDNSTITIKAVDDAGDPLGTVGTFALGGAVAAGARVALTLGAYVELPADCTLTYEVSEAGAGATIGAGAYIKLTPAA